MKAKCVKTVLREFYKTDCRGKPLDYNPDYELFKEGYTYDILVDETYVRVTNSGKIFYFQINKDEPEDYNFFDYFENNEILRKIKLKKIKKNLRRSC